MTFNTCIIPKLNICSFLSGFCQGFASSMWLNFNRFGSIMNATSLFSLGQMNWSMPSAMDIGTFPSLFSYSLNNFYQGNTYNFNNDVSLFTNNNCNYINTNGGWSTTPQYNVYGPTPSVKYDKAPAPKDDKAKKIVGHRNIDHDCFKNPPNGTVKKTLPNGQEILAFSNCNAQQCNDDWADLQEYLMQVADEMGLTLVYVSLARTNAEQQTLYSKNPTYTAKPGTSAHNYGIASDIALYDKNGHKIDPHSETMAEFARKVKKLSSDIEWGGDWASIGDGERHHFNIKNRKKYQIPENLVT